jgi:hypothetical protein
VGSRSLVLNKKFLLQLLNWEFGKGFRSSDPKCILILNTSFTVYLVTHGFLCRVPQDIHPASHANKNPVESESPRVDKPPSHSARESTPKTSKPPGPEDTEDPSGAKGTLTSPSGAILGHEVAPQFPSPKPTEHPEASLENPESFGLEAPGRREFGEGSSVPRSGKQPRQYSCVTEFLWDNLDFIQARFHIGWYISAFVNSEVERGHIKVLYSSMKSTSELIDVIIFTSYYPFCLKI